MANEMNVPIIGLVENYSYVECPTCKEKINVFGDSHVEEVAKKFGLTVLAHIPMTPIIAEKLDNGAVEELEGNWLDETADFIESQYVLNDED
jgi:hypothetical protein